MKNLAKLRLQQAQAKGKTKPMASARTARAVPQLRKVAKALTGYKKGGEIVEGIIIEISDKKNGGVIRPKPTFQGKVLKPKPINKRGVGAALRGFGKALRKSFGGLR